MNKLHLIILSLMALVSAREFRRLKNSNLMSAQRLASKKKGNSKKDDGDTEKKEPKRKKDDEEGQDSKLLANTFMNTHNLLASKSGLAPPPDKPEGESGSGGSQEGKDKDKEEGDKDKESSKSKKSKKGKKKDESEGAGGSSLKTRGSSNSEALLQRKSGLLSEDVENKDYLNASAANDEEDDSE